MSSIPSRTDISRLLSHALRHVPGEYGLVLDPEGWVPVSEVLGAFHRLGPEWESVDEAVLQDVLATAEKKRHQIKDGRIRAVHGHSVPVQPSNQPSQPPAVLFHGTARDAVAAIREAGILPMQRQYVHLSETVDQARQVGRRKDTDPVILAVDTSLAVSQGVGFHRSASGVWLAETIPAAAVDILEEGIAAPESLMASPERLRQITAELAALYEEYSYDDMARYFKSVLAMVIEAEGRPAVCKDVARDILSAYRGMGSLNDQVIMHNGVVAYEANGRLNKLLRELHSVAVELATRRPD